MNDHEAIDAIDAVLEQYSRTQVTSVQAMNYIAQIVGANKISHNEVKEQK
jgi:hypothetical protein